MYFLGIKKIQYSTQTIWNARLSVVWGFGDQVLMVLIKNFLEIKIKFFWKQN